MTLDSAVGLAGHLIEAGGVAIMLVGAVVSAGLAVRLAIARQPIYDPVRLVLGRSILLGLELLVAGDIIYTVVAAPTLTGIAILAAIVLIRTFLSFTLTLELTGEWPWQHGHRQHAEAGSEHGA